MKFIFVKENMREYMPYCGDLCIPKNGFETHEVSFEERNGETYFKTETKTKGFYQPISEDVYGNVGGEFRPIGQRLTLDKNAVQAEQREKEYLLSLPLSERVRALKETVCIHLQDLDTGSVWGMLLTPYIDRFTHSSEMELFRSLPKNEQADLLKMPTKEYNFDNGDVMKRAYLDRHRYALTSILESLPPDLRRSVIKESEYQKLSLGQRIFRKVLAGFSRER